MLVRQIRKIIIGFVLAVSMTQPVFAQSSSPSYKVEETYFGSGGAVDLSSPGYQGQAGLGSLGVGSSSSANYDAEAGFYTPNQVFLEFVVTGATVELGVLSPSAPSSGAAQAGTCNCSFYVRSYLSSAYIVTTISNPPTSESGHSFAAKATTGAPSTDSTVEEFGINVVANTSPVLGANPFNDPSGMFADGTAAAGYNVANQFKYGIGDNIARSPATVGNQGTGKTNFTISYIIKPKNTTPAGTYRMDHVLVAIPTY
ncbi:MAG: hypothetical protein V4702_02190 [Patescibacteria group bacterium]